MPTAMLEAEILLEEFIRSGRKLYRVAADAGVSPSRLGAMLRGRLPLAPDVAKRVRDVLRTK